MLDPTRLLCDLQQVNDIARAISGSLDPERIARQITDALVERFPCVFARLWLLEDPQTLRLLASSGLHTRTDGSFARVPLGAFKVGKIAQNCVPFLSNHLADESWVKDRDWAIANGICGFAGYPLLAGDRAIGVLAAFSREAFADEFLEVLQVLSMTAAVALDAATQAANASPQTWNRPLSDAIAARLDATRVLLVGTERPLPPAVACLLQQAVELLSRQPCRYARLTYGDADVTLEAIVTRRSDAALPDLDDLQAIATGLGGTLQIQGDPEQATDVLLRLPLERGPLVAVASQFPAVQAAVVHLCRSAGLSVRDRVDVPCLTDDPARADGAIWIRHARSHPVPPTVAAVVDLYAEGDRLRQVVDDLGADAAPTEVGLSGREREVLVLLARGLRDREVAGELFISESTVKFHAHNCLTKLNAKNRYQAVYEATIRGWI